MKLKRPIIALDFNDAQRTLDFLQNFPQTEKLFVKIGMELYYSCLLYTSPSPRDS